MAPTPGGTRLPRRATGWIGALALVVAVGAGAWTLDHRHDGPGLPYRGAAAAAFLEHQTGGNDSIVRADCSSRRCAVWLRPIPAGAAVPTPRLYQDLAVDVVVVGNLGPPGGAVATSSWRFTLVTRTGVLTATCTNAEARRVGGLITPSLLPSICPTRWRPRTT
jgi:hypothetical protein